MAPVASSQARLTGGCRWQRPPPLSTELFGVLTPGPLAFKGVSEPRGQVRAREAFTAKPRKPHASGAFCLSHRRALLQGERGPALGPHQVGEAPALCTNTWY